MKKIIWVVVVFLVFGLILLLGQKQEVSGDYIACLKDAGVVIYGTKTCPACTALAESMGGYDVIAPIYVECWDEEERCALEMKTNYVPEIQINGEVYQGNRDMLGQEVGCK